MFPNHRLKRAPCLSIRQPTGGSRSGRHPASIPNPPPYRLGSTGIFQILDKSYTTIVQLLSNSRQPVKQATIETPDRRHWLVPVLRWLDTSAGGADTDPDDRRLDWLRIVPFIGLHLACLGVIWVGWSPVAVAAAGGLYLVRMFALTAFYHRYFSHRAFSTHRVTQFLFALLANTAVQRGPLWWAAHHRHHHRHSDKPEDVHSPVQHGFLRSHLGWFLTRGGFQTRNDQIPDLARYPELRLLDRFNNLVPIALATGTLALGAWLEDAYPELGTSGPQMLVWGFFISTTVLFHASVTINSLAHRFGRRRFQTADNSRNNWWLALLTLGEGWHNNHHRFPGSARQGMCWWEIDLTWYGLKLLERLGLIWDLKSAPAAARCPTRGKAAD